MFVNDSAASRPGAAARAGAAALRRLRAGTAVSAALAVPAAALLFSAAGARAAVTGDGAATRGLIARSAVSALTWHKLTLINGWKADTAGHGRAPAYAISGGIVYLAGYLSQPVSGVKVFAVLPRAARPAHDQYRLADTASGVPGGFAAYHNGWLWAYGGNAGQFTSLAGISWPAASVSMHKLALRNGWAGGPFNSGSPGYVIKNGVVHLTGGVDQPSGTNAGFTVLPKAARPAHLILVPVYAINAAIGWLSISPTGVVFAYSNPQGNAQTFTSLAGVSWPARGATWHKLSLINGWHALSPSKYGPVSYAVINGVVYLSGVMQQSTGASITFAHIPAAIRPAHYALFADLVDSGTGYVSVSPADNLMISYSPTNPGESRFATVFGGISYPLSN